MESEESADDSLCILYEKLIPQPDIQIVNEIGGHSSEETETEVLPYITILPDSPQRAVGTSQNIQFDDSICILQENKKSQPEMLRVKKKSAKDDENVSEPSRNEKKTKIECGICFDSLNEILESNRTLVSTVCGHIFCNACMEASRLNSTQCPNCRKRLGKNQFHPIYF